MFLFTVVTDLLYATFLRVKMSSRFEQAYKYLAYANLQGMQQRQINVRENFTLIN